MGETLNDGWDYKDSNGTKHWIGDCKFFCQLLVELGWTECTILAEEAGYENLSDLKRTAYTVFPASRDHMENSAYMADKLIEVIKRKSKKSVIRGNQ